MQKQESDDEAAEGFVVESQDSKKNCFIECIIIHHDGWFNIYWSTINSILCIASSYFYSWLTCFGNNYDVTYIFYVSVGLESFFLLSMIFSFVTDYHKEGEKQPVKDIVLIMKNYLNKGFILDLIPLIPI